MMLELFYTILHYIGISYYVRIISSNPAIILALTFILDKNIKQRARAVCLKDYINLQKLCKSVIKSINNILV